MKLCVEAHLKWGTFEIECGNNLVRILKRGMISTINNSGTENQNIDYRNMFGVCNDNETEFSLHSGILFAFLIVK